MPNWDPALYLQFDAERTQPAIDLVNRIHIGAPRRIADLGCGPGNSTAVLAARWAGAKITGIDNSREMLEQARGQYPAMEWEFADIGQWSPAERFDLLFSNAALQWVTGQQLLLPRLVSFLNSGGMFAAQIPYHLHSLVHRVIEETAQQGPWAARLRGAHDVFEIRTPAEYYDILAPHSRRVQVWVTEYIHVFDSPTAIVTWMQGTGLRPYLARLTEDEQADFLRAFGEAVSQAYRPQADGRVLFGFPRMFLLAETHAD